MNNITSRTIYRQLQSFSDFTLKKHLGRKRLKFSRKEISFLLYVFYVACVSSSEFKTVHRNFYAQSKLNMKYSSFMNDLKTLTPLFFLLFRKQIKNLFKKNKDFEYLITDTSILLEKENYCLKPKDKFRIHKRKNRLYCGKKISMITDEFNRILGISLGTINRHDSLFVCDIIEFKKTNKINFRNLLADKAYGSLENRNFSKEHGVFLCSPYRKNQVKQLNQTQAKLYKNRSKIENIFKAIKNPKGNYRLSLKGVRNVNLQEGMVYMIAWMWNKNIFSAIFIVAYIGFTI